MIATIGTMGLSKWIIDDTCLIFLFFFTGCCVRVGPRHRQDRQVHAHREVEEQREVVGPPGAPIEGT